MKTRISLLLISLLSALGCTSYTVRPEDKVTSWQSGKGFVETQDNHEKLSAALDYQGSGSLNFVVEIENLSDTPVVVGPQSFTLTGSGLESRFVPANDPEVQIEQINIDIEHNRQILETSGAEAVGSILTAVTIITGAETDKERQDREQRERDRENQKANARDRITYLENQKANLEKYALRKNTLAPKTKLKGNVQFSTGFEDGPIILTFAGSQQPLTVKYRAVKN